MTIYSMTGYALFEGTLETDGPGSAWRWRWELKSGNARGLDIRFRLPRGGERLEGALRERIAGRLARGSVLAQLELVTAEGAVLPRINRPMLDAILALRQTLEQDGMVLAGPMRLETLLGIGGMVEQVAPNLIKVLENECAVAAVRDGLDRALDALLEMRALEGARLQDILEEQLVGMERLHAGARLAAAEQIEQLRDRLQAQIGDLLGAVPALPERRLAQEVAVLVVKADIREEIERLGAHLAACSALLSTGNIVGRRLDFLCQELNRETNTICAKAVSLPLTEIGLDLKSAIEQFREQIQNLE